MAADKAQPRAQASLAEQHTANLRHQHLVRARSES